MTQAAPTAWPADGAQLLEPSIGYALGVVLAVTPELLSRPTPCPEWDLQMLLRHASESLAAFGEGIEAGRVGLDPAAEDGDLAADPPGRTLTSSTHSQARSNRPRTLSTGGMSYGKLPSGACGLIRSPRVSMLENRHDTESDKLPNRRSLTVYMADADTHADRAFMLVRVSVQSGDSEQKP
jgi:hypothetical protein